VGGVSGEEAEAEREAETAEGGGGECRILGVGSTSSLESLLSNASATNISASVMAAIVLVKALRVVWRASARGGVWCGWSGPYLTHNPNLQEKVFFRKFLKIPILSSSQPSSHLIFLNLKSTKTHS
jgi:hypothetical protein